jgi:hypothetical protein
MAPTPASCPGVWQPWCWWLFVLALAVAGTVGGGRRFKEIRAWREARAHDEARSVRSRMRSK